MKNNIQKNIAINNNQNNINYKILMPKSINSEGSNIDRIWNEFNSLKYLCVGHLFDIGYKLWLKNNNNPFEWIFTLKAPNCTPYSGGLFYLKAIFPIDYPNRSPEVIFVTPFYHININPMHGMREPLGHIDTAILNWWKPDTSMKEVIIDIISFFWGAYPECPYGLERQVLYYKNIELFNKRIKYFTKKYADPSFPYKEYTSWDFSCPNNLK